MSFYGDYEGALWAIATGTSGAEDCQNAEIMRGIAQEALGQAWTDYLNHQKSAKDAFGKVIPFAESSPEQPSYKHPEKDIFNLDEGEDTKLPDSPTEETTQAAVSEVTPSTPEEIETLRSGSDPITPMADLNPSRQDNYFDGLPNGQAQE